MTPELITNSRLTSFRTCQRLHQYRYVLGYAPLDDSEALDLGTAIHAGLENWWTTNDLGLAMQAMKDSPAFLHLDAYAAARAEIMLTGYDARWSGDAVEFIVLAVEKKFNLPLAGLRGIRLAGKIDVTVRKRADGTVWNVEHKTSGSDLSAGSIYWQRLRMDSQVSLYHDGGESLHFGTIAGTVYDVLGKPKIRPYKAGAKRKEDETPDEFKVRLAETVCAAPNEYYQRTEVLRLDTELEEARRDTRATAIQIRASAKLPHAARNPDACLKYGGGHPCVFYDVCTGAASIDDESRFKKLSTVHPELT